MDILELARRDAAFIINAGGFESTIVFKEVPTKIIKGLATKHHNAVDSEGIPINAKNTSITVNEADLVAAGIVVRNSDQEVFLRGKFVSYKDNTGISKNYIIEQTMANETLGHIVCILGDVEL